MRAPRLEKRANAFIPDATPSTFIGTAALRAVNRYGRKHGGLWVGGKVTATPHELVFMPNRINVAVHVGLVAVRIPLAAIRSVRREFGWITGIVVVEHEQGEFRFRCFRAKRVAEALSSHVTAL